MVGPRHFSRPKGAHAMPKKSAAPKITREAVETVAACEGRPVLEVLSMLQAGAARLNDGEKTLEALTAIRAEIIDEVVAVRASVGSGEVDQYLDGGDFSEGLKLHAEGEGKRLEVEQIVCSTAPAPAATDRIADLPGVGPVFTRRLNSQPAVAGAASAFIAASQWFQIDPLPDDEWDFTVKAENRVRLLALDLG